MKFKSCNLLFFLLIILCISGLVVVNNYLNSFPTEGEIPDEAYDDCKKKFSDTPELELSYLPPDVTLDKHVKIRPVSQVSSADPYACYTFYTYSSKDQLLLQIVVLSTSPDLTENWSCGSAKDENPQFISLCRLNPNSIIIYSKFELDLTQNIADGIEIDEAN